MSDSEKEESRCFIDTNIWLYAFIAGDDPHKTTLAREVIDASAAVSVSTQVINEACINLKKKAQFSEIQIQQLIESFYAKYLVLESSKPLLLKASELRNKHSFSFWDSHIVASALATNASILYSEDMHDGMVIDNQTRIVNPFSAPI